MKITLILLALVAAVSACTDNNRSCPGWRSYCRSNDYVENNCKRTCGTCGGGSGGNGVCGKPKIQRGRVVGGTTAVKGSWPWQIGMFNRGRFHCGGSLVNTKWIVTASHCIDRQSSRNFQIKLGDHDIRRNEGTEQTLSVRRFIKHPGYNSQTFVNDIALIELSRPAQFNQHVQPVCLPSKYEKPQVNSKCTITGWGKITHPGNSHPILQQLDLTILDNSHCNQLNSKYMSITRQMICGSNGRSSRQSGCHGDSGGPFVCKQNDGSYKLHGAVSWGSPRCDSSDSNTVFARVSEFRDWIDGYINN